MKPSKSSGFFKPFRNLDTLLEGKEINDTLLDECVAIVKEEISPISDIRGSADYRTYVTAALLKKNLAKAACLES